ncbi:HXXEE domain-containing protein [Bifidobacterium sp. ESL0682]|uniref:HXXEE domain-containing protein n=1 Tax=Bifidobacterium sp. ESL0682 TaxID=2983212 RepID=UPI0023F7ABE4|nr:HXXEE domain-containing protein [Bifidobacterium sp. ESL0682]WEV41337.1 HXXEE domain-containing protein [Bifidobacterium sp. ESL0682]
MSMFLSFWVLPIAFILHDFEEMILAPDWKRRDVATAGRVKHLFFGEVTHGPALCAGIAEEMFLLTAVSVICGITYNTTLYLACCVAYTFHLLPHLAVCPLTHSYVPGALTALIELPFMVWHISVY